MRPASKILLLHLASLLFGVSFGLKADTEVEKATELMKARSFKEAQAVLDRVVQADPRNARAFALLGELQLATRNPVKAVEYADKAIELEPGKASHHLLRGSAFAARAQQANVFRALGLAGDARESFEKAVRMEPTNRNARFALFSYYMNAPGIAGGGLDKARTFAEQTQAVDASRGHYMKGRVLQQQKKPDAARAEYLLASAADPQFAAVHNELGYVELELKQVDSALVHFRKQAELDPENANSYDSLGDGLLAKGSLDEAIASYRKALALNPVFPSSLRSLGKALEQAGRRDEAIQHYQKCAQLGVDRGIPAMTKESKERLRALGVRE